MTRRPLIAGNWKLNGTLGQAAELVEHLLPLLPQSSAEVVICPPFTALPAVSAMLAGTTVALGAQDLFWKPSGAYTGQISAAMLKEAGCRTVIVGHSERRGRFGTPDPDMDAAVLASFADNDATVALKAAAAAAGGLAPICCVGETLAERQAGHADAIICKQARAAIGRIPGDCSFSEIALAYEPVWAIGTGEVCDAAEAERICAMIRGVVAEAAGSRAGEAVRVLYGGSVKPGNAVELLAQPNIDGALVGGASLNAADFAAIAAAA
ncbi:MAG: triose-phosphate isomerase [Armatimonadetes bacterium]|nr:triose-phosphate isomerase [Armatimonadota bacterium]